MASKLNTGHETRRPEDSVVVLLALVEQLAHELHPHTAGGIAVTLDSTLERDLGFDSLGRVELLTRLERAFDVRLPEQLLTTAETVRDVLHAVQGAPPSGPPVHLPAARRTIREAEAAAPEQAETLLEVLDWHVRTHPQRLHIALSDTTGDMEDITYAALFERAQAGVPVVPLAIRGTRSLLRADQWFPRRGVVRLTLGAPQAPQGPTWAAAVQLRDAARAHMLQYGGEPELESTSEAHPSTQGRDT